jgi:predicted tellurium resistance membrane protein TerC
MDLVFSLDNVIAVLALSQYIVILIIGVCISILIMRFAATGFLKLISLEPSLVHAAYVLILAIAIELILKYLNVHVPEFLQFLISIAILLVFVAGGRIGRTLGWIKPKVKVAEATNSEEEPTPVANGNYPEPIR